MIAYLVLAAVLPAYISANLPIIPCPGHPSVAPTALRVNGCDSMPCHVGHTMPNHGHNFDYEADFHAHLNSQSLSLRIFESAFGVEHELTLPDINACNGLTSGSCPVLAGQHLTHGTNIEGEGDYHGGIPVQIRVEIADDAHVCMCALINLIVH